MAFFPGLFADLMGWDGVTTRLFSGRKLFLAPDINKIFQNFLTKFK